MIQNIGGNKLMTLLGTYAIQTAKSSVKNSELDSYIKTETQLSTIPDTYSKEIEEPISPEDQKYLGIATDGTTTLRFPDDSAPLATKKAWIETMKALTPDEQFKAKTIIFMSAQSQSQSQDQSFSIDAAQRYLSGITSYQDLLRNAIAANKKALTMETGLDAGDRTATEHTIQVAETILNAFIKNKVN